MVRLGNVNTNYITKYITKLTAKKCVFYSEVHYENLYNICVYFTEDMSEFDFA